MEQVGSSQARTLRNRGGQMILVYKTVLVFKTDLATFPMRKVRITKILNNLLNSIFLRIIIIIITTTAVGLWPY